LNGAINVSPSADYLEEKGVPLMLRYSLTYVRYVRYMLSTLSAVAFLIAAN
jgi:hypothetical protein